MNKLKNVLLVDDNPADNFLHEMVFDEVGCAEHIEVAKNGRQALDYITTSIKGVLPRPELICLDINMPVMDGWEFLEAYEKLPEENKQGIVLMMLTTSLNPDHEDMAKKYTALTEYTRKPLTPELLKKVLHENFPDRF